jgi:hypothetical protein
VRRPMRYLTIAGDVLALKQEGALAVDSAGACSRSTGWANDRSGGK